MPLSADVDPGTVDDPGEDGEEEDEGEGAASVMPRAYRFGSFRGKLELGGTFQIVQAWSVDLDEIWRRFDAKSIDLGVNWRKLDPPNVNVGAIWRMIDPLSGDLGEIWRKIDARNVNREAESIKLDPPGNKNDPLFWASPSEVPIHPPFLSEK